VVCGVWCVVCGVWCVVCGVWCVVCVVLCIFFSYFSSSILSFISQNIAHFFR
jgi:hypothetical protein